MKFKNDYAYNLLVHYKCSKMVVNSHRNSNTISMLLFLEIVTSTSDRNSSNNSSNTSSTSNNSNSSISASSGNSSSSSNSIKGS